ncbi:helix-turn-helix domain-containing protein [Duganella sp. FT3S]|uniref:Helix-turn-helix domain-containing protein n=1 Tax=Rugamonas fusca TaxID=2758568 RepID=A0A7W2EDD9_9BURK|nr:AraC family transcriptional regulator [Rugamonas fusca]MBA5603847.1 helix-turn-helix domain-containing protein [Rugamonas fusca]
MSKPATTPAPSSATTPTAQVAQVAQSAHSVSAVQPAGSMLPSAWFEPCIHSAYVQILAKFLHARGLALPWPQPSQSRLLPFLDVLPLLDAVQAASQPDFGIELGMAIPAAAHGLKGMAAMSSPTLWVAMETFVRYARIRDHLFQYRCQRAGGYATLELHPRVPLHQYTRFLQGATVHATFNIFRAIADEAALRQAIVVLPWDASTAPGSVPAAPWQVAYGGKVPAIRFPLAIADEPSQTADADLHARMCKAGDEELTRLAGSIGARVRHLMHQGQPAWPTLAEIAARLALSPRTLVRRLESEDLSYQQLLDEVRNELACWYLRQSALPMGDIAERTGFSDQANFTRAFGRWQGQTPREYRRRFQVDGQPA